MTTELTKAAQQPLEPCPFCGSTNVSHYEVEGRDNHSIECSECLSAGKPYKTKQEAVAAWNTRALTASQPAQATPEPVGEPGRWFTVVYKDVQPGDEARVIGSHPKARILSWSNAVHDRDDLLAAAQATGGEHG